MYINQLDATDTDTKEAWLKEVQDEFLKIERLRMQQLKDMQHKIERKRQEKKETTQEKQTIKRLEQENI